MIVSKRAYTLADLLALPPDDNFYELIQGELVVWSTPDTSHAGAVIDLILALGDAQRAGLGIVRTAPVAVVFDYAEHGEAAQEVALPDVLFILKEREGIIGPRWVEGAPDILVEVLSPTTRRHDLGVKRDLYARYGVPHYWIVDRESRTLRLYTLSGPPYVSGDYGEPLILGEAETLTTPLLPGLALPLTQLFRHEQPRAER